MPPLVRSFILPPFTVFMLVSAMFCTLSQAAENSANVAHIIKKNDKLNVNMSYPVLNVESVDKDISQWAGGVVNAVEDMLEKDLEGEAPAHPFELRADYDVSYPSANAVSITFTVSTYTGGAHDNIDIIVLSYDLNAGSRLSFDDIFDDQESALNIMSSFSYSSLSERFGEKRSEDMLKSGTTPDMDNFSSIALTKNGIIVHFQPYQVAPWSSGAQQVEISLEELHEAGPHLPLWGKK